MATITLKDAVRLMEDGKGVEFLSSNSDLKEYIDESIAVGGKILNNISDDELKGAVTLLVVVVCTDLIENGKLEEMIPLLKNLEVFVGMMTLVLGASVGMAVMEKWH